MSFPSVWIGDKLSFASALVVLEQGIIDGFLVNGSQGTYLVVHNRASNKVLVKNWHGDGGDSAMFSLTDQQDELVEFIVRRVGA